MQITKKILVLVMLGVRPIYALHPRSSIKTPTIKYSFSAKEKRNAIIALKKNAIRTPMLLISEQEVEFAWQSYRHLHRLPYLISIGKTETLKTKAQEEINIIRHHLPFPTPYINYLRARAAEQTDPTSSEHELKNRPSVERIESPSPADQKELAENNTEDQDHEANDSEKANDQTPFFHEKSPKAPASTPIAAYH